MYTSVSKKNSYKMQGTTLRGEIVRGCDIFV